MMQKIILVIFSVVLMTTAMAQQKPAVVKGQIADTIAKKGLAYATVSLVKATDSTLVSFTRADSAGYFQLKNITKGKYVLSASYVGYNPVWQALTVKENDAVLDMGEVAITDLKHLADVAVRSKRPPVVVNNDTIEFNAENFTTQPNAVVEDLLKKMPGMTVDADGTVRVNGQRINRVLVNGKEFFTGDPKLATKNLPADAIDKVQLFDKKSDQAEFTGIDDGNSQKTINLKLKKDRNNALFGRATAGAGNKERYDGQANINKFNGERQLSFLGMGNNTNRQGFSIVDVLNFTGELGRSMRGGGGLTIRTGDDDNIGLPTTGLGQNQQGVATTYAGGVNFNDKLSKKTDINASFIATDTRLSTERKTNRQNIVPGNNFDYSQNGNSIRDGKQQRINLSIDHKIDSFTSFKITPAIAFQQNKNESNSQYKSIGSTKLKLNDGYSYSISDADAINITNNMLFRKRFAKKGRTISANVDMRYNNSESDGTFLSQNYFYDNTGSQIQNQYLNQINNQEAFSRGIAGTITYTEPLWKKTLLELSYFYNSNNGESNKQVYDFNGISGKHDIVNTQQSNRFKSQYYYTGGTTNIRGNFKKGTYAVGASVQDAILKGINYTAATNIKQRFTDVLPSANIGYNFNRFRNLRLNYSTSTRQPSINQLQPIPDVSDPLNVRAGNPNLKREYVHNIGLNYFATDPVTGKNFFGFINYSTTQQAIIQQDVIDANGRRTSTPVNANGIYNLFGDINTGFPIKALNSRISVGSGLFYTNNLALVNGLKNRISNLSVSPNVSWSFTIEKVIDVQATARLNISTAKYSAQPQLNTNFLTQQYGVEVINFLPKGFTISNNFNYTRNTGRTQGFNTSIPLWNAAIAKSFMKNKRGEIKLSAFDLLNKNTGIVRNANQNYIEDLSYNVLNRYVMLSFTYSLNKSGSQGGPNIVVRSFGN
jgi:hypothetical protein